MPRAGSGELLAPAVLSLAERRKDEDASRASRAWQRSRRSWCACRRGRSTSRRSRSAAGTRAASRSAPSRAWRRAWPRGEAPARAAACAAGPRPTELAKRRCTTTALPTVVPIEQLARDACNPRRRASFCLSTAVLGAGSAVARDVHVDGDALVPQLSRCKKREVRHDFGIQHRDHGRLCLGSLRLSWLPPRGGGSESVARRGQLRHLPKQPRRNQRVARHQEPDIHRAFVAPGQPRRTSESRAVRSPTSTAPSSPPDSLEEPASRAPSGAQHPPHPHQLP